jgi:trans-4-hydroxy-L-proline dehydratase
MEAAAVSEPGTGAVGRVFNIQRCSVHDGPGIRTTVFLKGCPLSCAWCHNPEGIDPEPELMLDRERCLGCGACSDPCPLPEGGAAPPGEPWDPALCLRCGACAAACPTGARTLAGRSYGVDELVGLVARDRPFFEASDGGITFSGGEPGRRRAHRRRARTRAQGGAHLPGAHLPQRRRPPHPATRELTRYRVDPDVVEALRARGHPLLARPHHARAIFACCPGPGTARLRRRPVFTEFMEQRAPGHTTSTARSTAAACSISRRRSRRVRAALEGTDDPDAQAKDEQLEAMDIACRRAIRFAERHAELAEAAGRGRARPGAARRAGAHRGGLPAGPGARPARLLGGDPGLLVRPPRVITELNGWDAFNPGHLDQHLGPFYDAGLADGTLDRERRPELLQCLWVKFNNHPAPPKVGVTAEESGTYTDFANINLGGLRPTAATAVNDLSYLMLEVIDEMHLLQPSSNVQIAARRRDAVPEGGARGDPQGLRLPVDLQRRRGGRGAAAPGQDGGGRPRGRLLAAASRTAPSARRRTSSPATSTSRRSSSWRCTTASTRAAAAGSGRPPATRAASDPSTTFSRLRGAAAHFVDIKIRGNQPDRAAVRRVRMPAPFLSALIDDCIANAAATTTTAARATTPPTSRLSASAPSPTALGDPRARVREPRGAPWEELLAALARRLRRPRALRHRLEEPDAAYGNDDDRADELMRARVRVAFRADRRAPEHPRRPHHVDMLPTTCHVYFGSR